MTFPAAKIPVLFLGATGYLGGAVLSRFLTSKVIMNHFDFTLFIRSPEKAKRFEEELKLKTVVGSFDEYHKLEKLAEDAHLVITLALGDNIEMISAILRGLKTRHERLGDRPTVFHTSGSGLIIDMEHILGVHISDKICSDLDVDKLEAISPIANHRPADLLFLNADKEGYIRSTFMAPPTIYGTPRGAVFDAGLANTHSWQIPGIIRAALERGRVALIGDGQAVWDHVHIDDTVELYALIMEFFATDPSRIAYGREGYYFVENGEYLHRDLAVRVSQVLFALGAIEGPELVRFATNEEIEVHARTERYVSGAGTNARSRADRSRQLGWKPTKGIDDLWASIGPEAESLVKEFRAAKAEAA